MVGAEAADAGGLTTNNRSDSHQLLTRPVLPHKLPVDYSHHSALLHSSAKSLPYWPWVILRFSSIFPIKIMPQLHAITLRVRRLDYSLFVSIRG